MVQIRVNFISDSINIGNGLFELRVKEKVNIRIIYTFYGGSAWILHVFKKKNNKTPRRDIDLCLKRKRRILA